MKSSPRFGDKMTDQVLGLSWTFLCKLPGDKIRIVRDRDEQVQCVSSVWWTHAPDHTYVHSRPPFAYLKCLASPYTVYEVVPPGVKPVCDQHAPGIAKKSWRVLVHTEDGHFVSIPCGPKRRDRILAGAGSKLSAMERRFEVRRQAKPFVYDYARNSLQTNPFESLARLVMVGAADFSGFSSLIAIHGRAAVAAALLTFSMENTA